MTAALVVLGAVVGVIAVVAVAVRVVLHTTRNAITKDHQ